MAEPCVSFVVSPLAGRFVTGFSMALIHLRDHFDNENSWEEVYVKKTKKINEILHMNETERTEAVKKIVQYVTEQVENVISNNKTDRKTNHEWWLFPKKEVEKLAQMMGIGQFGVECAANAWSFWQGGNQWSSWSGFVTFFRYIVKFETDYSKWDDWEKLSVHSGPRFVHPDFCIICDRPNVLSVDNEILPHNENGPFCSWRDGSAIYSVHGVMIPGYIVESPELITIKDIETEKNAEIRRIMIDKYGRNRYIEDSGAKLIAQDDWGYLYRKDLEGDEPMIMCKMINSTPEPDGTFKEYWIRVHPECRPLLDNGNLGDPQELTALNAIASTFGKRGGEYFPIYES